MRPEKANSAAPTDHGKAKERLIKGALRGVLTEAQTRRMYPLGPEAVAIALLALSKRIAEQNAWLNEQDQVIAGLQGRAKHNCHPPQRRRVWCRCMPSAMYPGEARSQVPGKDIRAIGVNFLKGTSRCRNRNANNGGQDDNLFYGFSVSRRESANRFFKPACVFEHDGQPVGVARGVPARQHDNAFNV